MISSTAGIVTTKKYFSSVYIVSTKNFTLEKHLFSVTAGYLPDISKTEFMTGLFGGISYSPAKLKSVKLMAEYDTRVFNAGASVLLFKHFYIYGMAHELKRFAGGFAFTIPLIR